VPRVRILDIILRPTPERNAMAWKTPRIVEIAVGMEINTYACADL
jgi:coenzyme PQQ precursor peptide PqqA